MYKVGIDLGGTNIATGVVNEQYHVIGRCTMKTRPQESTETIMNDIVETVYGAIDSAGITISEVEEIGIGMPGTIDSENGIIICASNLNFHNYDVVSALSKKIGKKVYIENDANAAAYGEYLVGNGKNSHTFVMVTLGTGIGSAVLINGKLPIDRGAYGPEWGHTCVEMDGQQCGCGMRGCWEMYASATALVRQIKESMIKDPQSKMWAICQNQIEHVNGKTVFDGMLLGDETAKNVFGRYCRYVAAGLCNIISVLHPDVLCIGGGIARQGECLLKPIKEIVYSFGNEDVKKIFRRTELKIAKLGNDAGIIGAASIGTVRKGIVIL